MVAVYSSGVSLRAASALSIDGVPSRVLVKDIIIAGDWVHPSTGQDVEVSAERLERWASTFAAMSANGVKVYVPLGHTSDPGRNVGWVEDMWVEGNKLMARMRIIGEDGILAAARNHVSIMAVPELKDGKGNVYKDAIVHVALTPEPVISGQEDFIAASRGTGNVPVLRLACGGAKMPGYKKIAEKLGLAIEVDDDAAEAAIVAKIEEMLGKMKTMEEEMSKGKALAASRREVTDEVLSLARENRTMKLDRLVQAGKITPAVAKGLGDAMIGADGSALRLSLSGTTPDNFDGVLKALDELEPRALGEKTKAQGVELARGGDADSEKRQRELAKEYIGINHKALGKAAKV